MKLDRTNVSHGAIPVGKVESLTSQFTTTPYNTVPPAPALEWDVLPAGTDGYVLTCSAAAAAGVAWAAPATHGTVTSVTFTGDGTVLSSTPSTAVTASGTVTAALATATAGTFLAGPAAGGALAPTYRGIGTTDLPATITIDGGLGVHGHAAMPQPEYPGLAASTNAAQINAITAILEAYGLSKPATSITATLAGGAAVGNAAVQITTPFTVTLSVPAPAGGVVITPAGTLAGDKFQDALGGGDAATYTIAAGDSTVNIYYTPGAVGTAAVSITTSPVVTYAGSPKSVVVSA